VSASCPVFGFVVLATLHEHASETGDAFANELEALLAAHELRSWRRGRGLEFVIRREGSQATEGDRTIVSAWAAQWNGRATIAVGELVDLTNES
jgi:hypothetical protein